MPQIIEVPGMGQVEFPDGMSDDQITQAIRKSMPAQSQPAPQTGGNGASPLSSFGAGLGAGVGQTVLGAQHYIGRGLQALGAQGAGDWLVQDAASGREKLSGELAPYKAENPISAGAGVIGGNVASTLPVGGVLGRAVGPMIGALNPAAGAAASAALRSGGMAPGLGIGARVAGGATTGAATSALLDPGNTQSIATGAAVGGLLPPVIGGISRVIRPAAVDNAQLQLLRNEGVRPTVGQAAGGMLNAFEEKATSIPIFGDMIRSAREGAQQQLNQAAINRVMRPLGQSTSNIGREGLDDAYSALSKAYDDLLPKLQFRADNQFSGDIGRLQLLASGLEGPQKAQFDKILQQKVVGKMSQAGGMTGETFKQVEGDLGNLASKYAGSAMASDKLLGDAIGELQSSLRSTLTRSNPQYAQELRSINQGYANYARVRAAAAASGAENGVFTPAQLSNAVRSSDKSVGKGSYARGAALMQDLADAGRSVLGNKVPDSGTPGRLLPTAGLLGASALDAGLTAGLLGGGAFAYTRPVQAGLVSAIASRPESTKAVAEGLKRGGAMLSPVAVPAALYVGREP